jgi:hypothetical protein
MTMHHVVADGVGGLAVLGRLVDGAPAVAEVDFPRAGRAVALSCGTLSRRTDAGS